MRFETEHLFLVPESTWDGASHQVKRFFDRTILVKYASIKTNKNASLPATYDDFWPRLEKGLATNQAVLTGLLDEIVQEGYSNLKDLTTMEQGFQSKLLHTASHLLDGFFGIDSYFFNLVEDSHQVSERLRNSIKNQPQKYWLVEASGATEIPGEDPFSHLRTFETPEE